MANSYVQYSANGQTYAVPFQYLSKTHVTVKVNGNPVTFTWNAPNQIQLASLPVPGAIVEIRRTTPNKLRVVDFTDGSVLAADDLDTSALQFLYMGQEAQDKADLTIQPSGDGQWDAGTRRIQNAQAPVSDTDVTTKGWVDETVTAAVNGVAGQLVLLFVEKDSDADKSRDYYVHTQPAAALEWIVEHDLNTYPGVTIYDSTGRFVIAEYTFSTKDQLRIVFKEPTSGIAYVH